MKGFDQQGNYARQSCPRIFIGVESTEQFLADSQTPETGFSCRPEEIFLPWKVTENRNFADPSQPGDLVCAAGSETLSREELHGRLNDAVRGATRIMTF
jgi:hypothetical protein